MARFIRLNGALIRVADETLDAVLARYEGVKEEDLTKVPVLVSKDKTAAAVSGGAGATAAKLIFANTCDEKEVHCWTLAVGSGGTDITSGILVLHANGSDLYPARDLSSYNFAVSGTLTNGTSIKVPILPPAVVGSGELISIHAGAEALDTTTFTGSVSLDLRRKV